MIASITSTSQIPPLASARLTTDRETHRFARDNITHVELKRLTDHNPVRGFLCVFVSLREPFAPLARPQRAMLRGHVTERSWLPPLEGDNLLLKNHISAYQSISRFDDMTLWPIRVFDKLELPDHQPIIQKPPSMQAQAQGRVSNQRGK